MKKVIEYKKKIYYNDIFMNILRIINPLTLGFLNTKLIKVKGSIPKKGPLLIAAHHEEIADQYIIGSQIKRRLFWVVDITGPKAKKSFADTGLMKWFLIRCGAIPIDKRNSSRNVNLFEHLLFLLEKGGAIVFFPEAYVRSERKGRKFGEFKDGVIRLAMEYEKRFKKKVPICPIGSMYKKDGNIKKVYLKVGKRIFINSKKDKAKVFNKIKELSS